MLDAHRCPTVAVTALLVLLVPACAAEPEVEVEVAEAAPAAGGAHLAQFDSASPQDELPEGHPPLTMPEGHPPLADQGAMGLPPVDPGMGSGVSALRWEVPEDWVAEPPANPMRKAQYRIPGAAGEAECVVFYFGPGQGGDPISNAQRWAGQFAQPDGSDPLGAMKTETLDVGGIGVLTVETAGTYQTSPMMGGTGEPMPSYMLLGAIAEGPDASWFFKLTGPEDTVAAQRAAFQRLIGSLRSGA